MTQCKEFEKMIRENPQQNPEIPVDHRLSAHASTCKRCLALVRDLHTVGSVFQSRSEISPVLDNASIRSIIVNEMNRAAPAPGHSLNKIFSSLAFSSALIASIIIIGITTFFTMKSQSTLKSDRLQTLTVADHDSTITVNQGCSITVGAKGSITFDKIGVRIFKAHLNAGKMMLEAKRKSYDTIAIHCGSLTVFATGTRFSVERNNLLVRVAVQEGCVRVIADSGYKDSLVKNEQLVYGGGHGFQKTTFESDTSLAESDLPDPIQHIHHENYPGGTPKEKASIALSSLKLQQIEMLHEADKGSSTSHYTIIRSMIHKGHFQPALYAIKDYQLNYNPSDPVAFLDMGYCYYRLDSLDDAIAAFRKASSYALPEHIMRQTLHTINTLLYTKGDYQEAIPSIQKYLAAYPDSPWREQEFYYLVNALVVMKNINEARHALSLGHSEYPKSCELNKLLKILESHSESN